MQVNTGRDQTHHHGPLAGLGAGAAAIIAGCAFGGVLVLVVWRHIAGQVSAAVQVIVWALTAAIVAAVLAAIVYAALLIRHRILNPEALTRPPAVRAEVLDPPAPAPTREIPAAAAAAELPPGTLWRINPHAAPVIPAEKELS